MPVIDAVLCATANSSLHGQNGLNGGTAPLTKMDLKDREHRVKNSVLCHLSDAVAVGHVFLAAKSLNTHGR